MSMGLVVQARVDESIKERASAVLERMGLTVSDAMRMLLTRIANEGALPSGLAVDPASHDAWVRARVMEALNDPRPTVPHEEVQKRFKKRREDALRALHEGNA
jgi:DNA-damage-inducible protein J